MATVMAATYPLLYAAAGVQSGVAVHRRCARRALGICADARLGSPTSRQDPALQIPLIVFHGDHDKIVNVINASNIRQQRLGIRRSVTATDGVRVTRGRYLAATRIRRRLIRTLTMCSWSSGSCTGLAMRGSAVPPAAPATDPLGPDASAEMVRFFAERRRRQ